VLILEPAEFEEFNTILKLPIPNVYDGFCVVLNVNGVLFPVMLVAFHCHDVGVFVDVSLNWITSGEIPTVLFVVNEEVGAGILTLIHVFWVLTLDPPALDEFNLIEKLPTPNVAVAFRVVLNVNGVLFPVTLVAFHVHEVGELAEVSLNWTLSGAVPDVAFDVNDETGA
jgi:selenocysteine lyase/cysteine desulfurase